MISPLDPINLFKGVDTKHPIIVAVSGGSDSIALLLLVSSWAQTNSADLQIVTVDHGLRPEAAAEAAFVAGVSEGLDLSHVTLAWDGIKPDSGVSLAARKARYRLLEEFASDIGARTILAGHTANDQAETIIMRSSRGEASAQSRGLSGIARTTLLPRGTKLIRPLLGMMRGQLRDYLISYNQGWIEDPSNLDLSYERVRVRMALGDDEAKTRDICRFADIMGRYRQHVSERASEVLSDHLSVERGLVYSISDEALVNLAPPVRTLVLQVIIAIAGGAEYLVPEDTIVRLAAAEFNDRMTAGRAVIERRKAGYRFYREKRNLPAIIVGPGETGLWDGRLLINNQSAVSYFCSAPTREQLQEIESVKGAKLSVQPRAALASTPYLCGDGDDAAMPFAGEFQGPANLNLALTVRAIEHFCPEFDFSLLEFLKSMKNRLGSTVFRQL